MKGSLLPSDGFPADTPGYIEQWADRRGLSPLMGIDEAGRGCLAGPVVAAAVVLSPGSPSIHGLDDSKRLTPASRERLYAVVKEAALAWGIGLEPATVIDSTSILSATFSAMRKAALAAARRLASRVALVVVDGNQLVPGLGLEQKAWPKGDRLSWNCAAASVLAKVSRDRIMRRLDARYPGYGFGRHMGYGTREHLAAIRELGPCPIHRMSFGPLKVHRR